MPRLTRVAKQAQTRRKLLEAARTVFADQGVAGTSVDAIAEAAGFSKGAFYSNFQSKEELGLEVLRLLMQEESRALEAIAERFPDAPAAAFAAVADVYADRSDGTNASLLGLELLLQASRDENFRVATRQIFEERMSTKAAVVARLAEAMGRRLRAESRLIADAISAIGHGHAALTAGGANPSPIAVIVELMLPALLAEEPG